MIRLRAEYGFALAHLCACPPPVALRLSLLDFARMIDAIDRYDGNEEGLTSWPS